MSGTTGTARHTPPRDFRPVADALRREILRHYADRGEPLSGPAGFNTLETNSGFVTRRATPLEAMYLRRSGRTSLEGARVLDVGCGFGALALYLGARGAAVTGFDPNGERLAVGQAVADREGLPVRLAAGTAESADVDAGAFDLVLLNNVLCYVVDPERRAGALRRAHGALAQGGRVLLREPNGRYPVDQFTRLPGLPWLSPAGAARAARALGRHRSAVRLVSPRALRRELRAAGFDDAASLAEDGSAAGPLRRLARYQHADGSRRG